MKKDKVKRNASQKTPGTLIVEKYRPRMNDLTEAGRKRLLQEGLGIIYGAATETDHAHRG